MKLINFFILFFFVNFSYAFGNQDLDFEQWKISFKKRAIFTKGY